MYVPDNYDMLLEYEHAQERLAKYERKWKEEVNYGPAETEQLEDGDREPD